MAYSCPNGCPRDAGEYCSRHQCDNCSETLKPTEGLVLCRDCTEHEEMFHPQDDCDYFREYPREVDFGPEDSFADVTSWDDLSPF